MIIGSHVSFGKEQLLGSVKEAIKYDANTFMFYTGAPHNTRRSEINNELTIKAYELMKENNIDINNVICHAPYIINLGNKLKMDSWNFSISFLKEEIRRCSMMGIKYIVLHPGNYMTQSLEVSLANISEALNYVINPSLNVMILLETMAGKGTECGSNINEIKTIINNVENNECVGVCLDTCHINDAGYKLDEYIQEFDKVIGIDKVKCVHINDSKNIIGSHKDRHENIGFGNVGFTSIMNVINNEKLKSIPKILETPYVDEYPPYKFEIEMIRNNSFDINLKDKIIEYYK